MTDKTPPIEIPTAAEPPYHLSATPIACKHGYDLCPECDPGIDPRSVDEFFFAEADPVPTAAELNDAGVSCRTCDKKIDLPAGGLKCTYYNASTPTKGFCHNHPKLRGEYASV